MHQPVLFYSIKNKPVDRTPIPALDPDNYKTIKKHEHPNRQNSARQRIREHL
jgi:hypothetical protein